MATLYRSTATGGAGGRTVCARAYGLLTALLMLTAVPAARAGTPGPDFIVGNVRGYTLTDAGLRHFDALYVRAGRVAETGETRTLRSAHPEAAFLDGHRKTLLPGLIDAHGHVLGLGEWSLQAQLAGSRSLGDALARIGAYARQHPERAWVTGGGWNQVDWRLGRFPTAVELDRVVANRPAVLERIDGHAVWANSAALRAAAVTRDTPDPPGGRIERDASGEPSGVLVDGAMDLVQRVVPPATPAERERAVTAALKQLAAVGLTSVGDAGVSAADVALYRQLADEGRLTARIYAMISDVGPDFEALAPAGPLVGYGHDHLTVRAVKLFADGALGSRGAALLAPYSDAPDQSGLLFHQPDDLTKRIQTALRAGYQVNVHAIGDAANREVLDAFAAAYRVTGGSALRNRIEHAQVIDPADIPRFKALSLIASMQPTHATSDKNMAPERLGTERLKGAYAWRTLLDAGVRLAGGSDFPVESPNPFFGLHAAVTRTDHQGMPEGGWMPEQRLSLEEAFRLFTLDAAYAQHQEATLGSLEPGKWADFILVDRDPFAMPARDLWKIRVEQTWVGGARVH